ncbi:MAG TPA: hypothetical protein PKU96_06820 [bacterium]|nr:hypothetical protein [Myxococcales bacterium]OQA61210.1 MAG: hypothetical protein BWY40_00649 [bacterium ADurb.Bin270]HPW46060.1 hypothetical protein [bacterium]HQC51019.1 hypothetical protein [bacterium]HQG13504.1 hypothetical protein [bacterium]
MPPKINIKRSLLGGLVPNEFQTDVAHMVDFAHNGLPLQLIRSGEPVEPIHQDHKIAKHNNCNGKEECLADHYFGSFFDVKIGISEPPPRIAAAIFEDRTTALKTTERYPKSYIESLMICPRPAAFNTGAHRIVVVFWTSAERFAAAFEEGGSPLRPKDENFFVDGLTPKAEEMLLNPIFIENQLLPSIVEAMTGQQLFKDAHNFLIKVNNPSKNSGHTGHWFEGCRPSNLMYKY